MLTYLNGIPHGSILGPLVFLLYINQICDQFKSSSYHMYADDIITVFAGL